jgi:hypothetical protein
MAGAKMGGGPGNAGIYDPRGKAKEKAGKGGYWPAVQADLTKQETERQKGKTSGKKKIGR